MVYNRIYPLIIILIFSIVNINCFEENCSIKMFTNTSDFTLKEGNIKEYCELNYIKYYCFKDARISNRINFLDSISNNAILKSNNWILLYIKAENKNITDTLLITDSNFMILNNKLVKKDSLLLNYLKEFIPLNEERYLWNVLKIMNN